MKKGITFYQADECLDKTKFNSNRLISKAGEESNWYLARPLGFSNIVRRLKAIKLVWKENADLIIWAEDYKHFSDKLN